MLQVDYIQNPGLRPDFNSQPWRTHGYEIKSGRRPGNEAGLHTRSSSVKHVHLSTAYNTNYRHL